MARTIKFTPEAKIFYDIFSLPRTFSIDKGQLKKNYYSISRQSHPDITNSATLDAHSVNRAFSVLNDDLSRAKLFTRPSKSIPQSFLSHCLDLEEKIRNGADLKDDIMSSIEECKKHYDDPVWVCKWSYYQRLLDIIRDRATEH